MSFWLEFFENGQKREFTFNNSRISIGRDQGSDFVLDHPTVSRQHAVIQLDQTGAKLVVLSRGGLTALNGQQVAGEVPLSDGSQIHFGQLAFTFRSPQTQQQQQPQTDGWEPAAVDAWSQGAGFDKGGDARVGRNRAPNAPAAEEPPPPVEPEFPNPNTGGIQSWDEIAAGANEEEEDYDGATNFQRLQAAQRKAQKQSQGTNPVLLIGAVLLGGGMLAYSFMPSAGVAVAPETVKEGTPEINWQPGDIKCSVPADCKAQAIQAYMFASETFEKRDVDVSNLYTAYSSMDKAKQLLEMGNITEVVPELEGIDQKQDEAFTLIKERFQALQIKYKNYEKRKMYTKMADTLDEIQAFFPDKRHKKNLWAVLQERDMRDRGIYPRRLK